MIKDVIVEGTIMTLESEGVVRESRHFRPNTHHECFGSLLLLLLNTVQHTHTLRTPTYAKHKIVRLLLAKNSQVVLLLLVVGSEPRLAKVAPFSSNCHYAH